MNNPVLKKVRFDNYKRFFKAEELELRPVTILVGKNSSGKSSVARLFPMLRCSLEETAKTPISFVNDGVSLGSSFGNLCHNGNSVGLSFGVTFDTGMSVDMQLITSKGTDVYVQSYSVINQGHQYLFKLHKKKDEIVYISEQGDCEFSNDFRGFVHGGIFERLGIQSQLAQCIDYIGPIRELPARSYYYTNSGRDNFVGKNGSRAYSMLYEDKILTQRVSSWFERTMGGCKLKVADTSEAGVYQVLLNKRDQKSYDVNIADEGMGIGQILPIIVRCLQPIANSIVVIEQPELHLHPAAHRDLAMLFAETSKQNNHTYVVETHSENVLLGLREAIVDNKIDFNAKDAIIYFVDENEDGAYLRKIEIDDEGMLSDWPQGVFNESYEILNQIMQKAGKK